MADEEDERREEEEEDEDEGDEEEDEDEDEEDADEDGEDKDKEPRSLVASSKHLVDVVKGLPSESGTYSKSFAKGLWARISLTWKGKDPWNKGVRKAWIPVVRSAFVGTTIVLTVTVISLLLFYGFLWNPPDFYNRLGVLIVNNDGDDVGNFFVEILTKEGPFGYVVRKIVTSIGKQLIRFLQVQSGLDYQFTSDATNGGDYWASIWIPNNYTASLNNSLYGNYEKFTQTIYYFYDEGRYGFNCSITPHPNSLTSADIK